MPGQSDIEKRDRAVVAFAILSGARDDAIASMLIRHVDLDRRTVFHDARDVRTKNRKTFTSIFFPVGTDIETIVGEWISFLAKERLFGLDEPLFPSTRIKLGAWAWGGRTGRTCHRGRRDKVVLQSVGGAGPAAVKPPRLSYRSPCCRQ